MHKRQTLQNWEGNYQVITNLLLIKNTAFNKNFGTGSSDVARGDHGHSDLHSHANKTVLDAITAAVKTSYDGAVTLASNALPSSSYTASDVLSKLKTVDGTGTGLDADLLDGNHASAFATSTHNHDGTYSTTDTKNTAGATDTSSKIYLVGSTAQSANPQTYTHDTAYVGTDGNLYSGSSKTITNSDLVTNQIVTPTLNPTWTVRNYAGTVVSSPTNPSGGAITGTSIVLEYGF